MIYLDSSALVKRYIEESGSTRVSDILTESDWVVVSRLVYAEVLSAITRRHKAGNISTRNFERISLAFKSDWDRFVVMELRNEVWGFVERIIARHALKAADSIHLSTALWLQQSLKTEVFFISSDIELLKAAQKEKLKIINPQDDNRL
jgi:predicted nucleic acid-binding protein